ncbi:hypothetical protein T281_18005 [Rhodomicrobium udaipurense JA643]|nr:hypothetical protein T281_18005 [Rhodomicrobium udaipurense JA643]
MLGDVSQDGHVVVFDELCRDRYARTPVAAQHFSIAAQRSLDEPSRCRSGFDVRDATNYL